MNKKNLKKIDGVKKIQKLMTWNKKHKEKFNENKS